MTTREKARELMVKFDLFSTMDANVNKECALIAVDEIISLNIKYHGREIEDNRWNIEYWEEVKKEIEKL